MTLDEQLAQELIDIAEDVPKVYESGQKSEYDRFWDGYQDNGNRTSCAFLFAGKGWTNDVFQPKYSIKPSNAYGMFWQTGISGDLEKFFDEKGIVLDFSKCSYTNYCFSQANSIKTVGIVDVSSAEKGLLQTFAYNSGIETIRVFKVREEQTYSSIFPGCTSLKNIEIEGVIGNNFDIQQSPLTHESLMSIINHLGTYTTTKTLNLGSTNLAKLTDVEKAIATGKGWTLA